MGKETSADGKVDYKDVPVGASFVWQEPAGLKRDIEFAKLSSVEAVRKDNGGRLYFGMGVFVRVSHGQGQKTPG